MALVNIGTIKIGISLHLHGLPCPVKNGKTTSKEMQNIPYFFPSTEKFLANMTRVRDGAIQIGKFWKVHLHSSFIYLQRNTVLLAVCIVRLPGSVRAELANRKRLAHRQLANTGFNKKASSVCATTSAIISWITSSPRKRQDAWISQ